MQKYIEPYINSREVAGMVDKEHNMLLRDIRRYCKQLGQSNIAQSDFFTEYTYQNSQNKVMPCYKVTKKGCEFIAHKLTGTKGTAFTARYINRFHEMEDIISHKEIKTGLPWFIREFNGKYIILERDFIQITGFDIRKHKLFYRPEYFTGGTDWNGWGWYTVVDKEKFRQEYGFDYGDDKCMCYLYPCGVVKALDILMRDKTVHIKEETYKMLIDGIKSINPHKEVKNAAHTQRNIIANDIKRKLPVNISITIGGEKEDCRNNILL